MPATLITSAAGNGKTQAAIARIQRLKRLDPFAPVWILLPTTLQIANFRARLTQASGEDALFGIEFFDFYTLNARVLEVAGNPQRRAQDTVRFRILRRIITELREQLRHFQRIYDLPGFISIVASFIYELKQSLIEPEMFSERAVTAKDHDLALIYARYQEYLKSNNLVDREGEGWLALAELQKPEIAPLPIKMLIIDGYDQFTVVQSRILNLLAERVPQVVLTLTYEPHRAETAHRRFAQTLERLGVNDKPRLWTVETAPPQPENQRTDALTHLSAHIFDLTRPDSQQDSDPILLLEAPDRRREVQSVLRKVKRLILNGTPPDQIAIVGRSVEPYISYFLENATTYTVPLYLNRGAPLRENPAVAAFLTLIDLSRGQFQRRTVMDVLRSPYLSPPDLSSAQINRLERLSRDYVVVRWAWTWFKAIESAARIRARSGDDENEEEQQLRDSDVDEINDLRDKLEQFFHRITPPKQNTVRGWISWLEGLIGIDPYARPLEESPIETDRRQNAEKTDFDLIARVRDGTDPDTVGRDLAALRHLKLVFAELIAACELVDGNAAYTWDEFRRDLLTTIDNATIDPVRSANRVGRVMLTTIYAIRGLPHDHIFVLGLSEGEFPAAAPEDPLYLDSERLQLRDRGFDLPTRISEADESSLFYELTALARQSLTLVRPYMDDRGIEWQPSPYWRAVQDITTTHRERLPLADRLALEDCAHEAEYLLALAINLSKQSALDDQLSAAHTWLTMRTASAAAWHNAQLGRRVEWQRASPTSPHDGYTGRLTDPVLVDYVAGQLGLERLWSASQLNDYGICPYRFFAKRMLRLETLDEPEDGMDAAQHGSLIHELLEVTYQRITADELAITASNRDSALRHLNMALDELLPDAPFRHGFRETRLWQHEMREIRRALVNLINIDFNDEEHPLYKLIGKANRRSIAQEVGFGGADQPEVIIDGMAGALKVRGVIDRIDEVGGKLVVVDYKTGSRDISREEMVQGRNVQMLIYLQAAQQIFPDQQVLGGVFWHVHRSKLSGITQLDKHDSELVEAAQNLHTRVEYGRQGVFINVASKPEQHRCASYCEFHHLCRAHATNRHKLLE